MIHLLKRKQHIYAIYICVWLPQAIGLTSILIIICVANVCHSEFSLLLFLLSHIEVDVYIHFVGHHLFFWIAIESMGAGLDLCYQRFFFNFVGIL